MYVQLKLLYYTIISYNLMNYFMVDTESNFIFQSAGGIPETLRALKLTLRHYQ